MQLINVIREKWEDSWQRVARETLTIFVMLSAVATAVLALFGIFD